MEGTPCRAVGMTEEMAEGIHSVVAGCGLVLVADSLNVVACTPAGRAGGCGRDRGARAAGAGWPSPQAAGRLRAGACSAKYLLVTRLITHRYHKSNKSTKRSHKEFHATAPFLYLF